MPDTKKGKEVTGSERAAHGMHAVTRDGMPQEKAPNDCLMTLKERGRERRKRKDSLRNRNKARENAHWLF